MRKLVDEIKSYCETFPNRQTERQITRRLALNAHLTHYSASRLGILLDTEYKTGQCDSIQEDTKYIDNMMEDLGQQPNGLQVFLPTLIFLKCISLICQTYITKVNSNLSSEKPKFWFLLN